jgi:hypothetical protein
MHALSTRHAAARVCATLVLVTTSPSVLADDLFDGIKPREFAVNAPLPADSTMGGYAIYQGDNKWRVISNKVGNPNSFGVSYGTLRLLQYEGGVYAAEMATSVNLNQSARGFYLTTSFCAGEHLVKVELISFQGNEGTTENCLTVDPYVATVSNRQITTLSIKVTNTQSAARLYQIHMLINPAVLGFAGTSASDWTTGELAKNPQRKQFMDRVTVWGKQLQSAAKEAIAFSKPKDAFKAVPSWRVLAANVDSAAGATLPVDIRPATTAPVAGKSVAQRLAELKDLFDQGLVSLTEYENKRKSILEGL